MNRSTCRSSILAGALAAVAVCSLAGAPPAHREPVPQSASQLVRVDLVSDVEAIAPEATFHLVVLFEIEPHWHTYWENPGASGAPPLATVRAPEGFKIGAPRFPKPSAFQEEVGTTYGYEREAAIFIPVTAPTSLPAGTLRFEIDIFYLVCRDVCLVGRETHSVELAGAASGTAPARSSNPRVARLATRLPRPWSALEGTITIVEEDRLILAAPVRDGKTVGFFPIDTPLVRFGAPEITQTPEAVTITVPIERMEPVAPRGAPHTDEVAAPPAARCLITFGSGHDDPSYLYVLDAAPPEEPSP